MINKREREREIVLNLTTSQLEKFDTYKTGIITILSLTSTNEGFINGQIQLILSETFLARFSIPDWNISLLENIFIISSFGVTPSCNKCSWFGFKFFILTWKANGWNVMITVWNGCIQFDDCNVILSIWVIGPSFLPLSWKGNTFNVSNGFTCWVCTVLSLQT